MILFGKKTIFLFVVVLLVLNFFAWQEVFRLNSRTLKVSFFDVGQGDSIFIESSRGNLILIDGGPDSTVLEKLREEIPFFRRKIDLVVLTHAHADHYVGLIDVLEKYRIENVLWTGVTTKSTKYQEFEKMVEESGAKIHTTKPNQKIVFPSGEKYLDILYPLEDISGKKLASANLNETSIVARLISSGGSFLFTGDICKKVEREMIEEGTILEADVLKVAHHGSRYSTSKDFLEESLPKLAVIQAGKNNHGHPHEELLSRLKEFGIKVLITKEYGDIKVVSDGNKLLIKN